MEPRRKLMDILEEKLIIVSTRLPVSVSKKDGVLRYTDSTGGLATGINSIKKSKGSVWIGWPGIATEELTDKEIGQIKRELKNRGCVPVFLTQVQIDNFYSGYSNATLWPLFHYFSNKTEYKDSYWQSYREVNELFTNETLKTVSSGATIWVHDYQLMLMPQMLRNAQKDAMIGFFMHIPFPSYEIFRLLPEREELLSGLLGANLIGFHTYDYVRHFLNSVQRILGYEETLGVLKIKRRFVRVDAFPIGINYKKYSGGHRSRAAKKLLKSFNVFRDKTKIILAFDRADYTKGIPARLDAFELFLQNNPEYHEKVVLILVASPSRSDVEAYKELRSDIEQKVSHINGEFATAEWSPIKYRHQSVKFDEVSALYALADVMLVTPHRDGMNLIAKEYVAAKHKNSGVLILSEMAGAAIEFPDALLVNPNHIDAVAESIKKALSMSKKEQKQRMRKMQARISEHTIEKWANDFVSVLSGEVKKRLNNPKALSEDRIAKIVQDYNRAKSRLILLDYDGTLKNFVNSPDAKQARPTTKVRKLINNLTKDRRNKVVIVSGRLRQTLESFFNDINLGLIAEHGGWIFDSGEWIKGSVTNKKWKKNIKPVLETYTRRTPGSEVEEKDFSLVWHYRRVSPDLAYVRKEDLKHDLRSLIDTEYFGIYDGQKIIEIKPKRMNKGSLVTELISRKPWDFILAIGDDYTDEDMFDVLPERAYSIHVGSQETKARYQIEGVDEVLDLVTKLIQSDR